MDPNKKRYDFVHNSQIKNRFGKTLRVICVPKNMVEDTIYLSCNGTEQKVINKDILDKLPIWLNSNQYDVINQYYLQGKSMPQIAKQTGRSIQRISQLRQIALRNIRQSI